MDMSTSVVSEGKLKINYLLKKRIDKNIIIDNLGKVSQNPKSFYENPKGAILPLGGISAYKGYGLSMAVDILSGALSEAGCSSKKKAQHGNSVTFITIKINSFTSIKNFRQKVADLITHVKSSRLQKGFKKILIPGEPEKINMKKNKKKGVDINFVTLKEIKNLLKKRNIRINI